MNYKTNTIINVELLESFYKDSSLTLEGISMNSINDYAKHLDSICGLKNDAVFHIVKGAHMNDVFNLYGDCAYPDDLNIVVIKNDCLKNISSLVTKRFDFGGRWFNDVVDNNAGLY